MEPGENETEATQSPRKETAGEIRSRRYERGSGRERVLEAYASILLKDGVAAATMDEVARQADISKGGLLHHFASKEALVEGLLEMLLEANAENIEHITAAGPDLVAAYLSDSTQATGKYSRLLMAAMRFAGTGDLRVDEAIRRTEHAWYEALVEHLGDPLQARLVQLVGDGLYLNALIGNAEGMPDDEAVRELVRHLVRGKSGDVNHY